MLEHRDVAVLLHSTAVLSQLKEQSGNPMLYWLFVEHPKVLGECLTLGGETAWQSSIAEMSTRRRQLTEKKAEVNETLTLNCEASFTRAHSYRWLFDDEDRERAEA